MIVGLSCLYLAGYPKTATVSNNRKTGLRPLTKTIMLDAQSIEGTQSSPAAMAYYRCISNSLFDRSSKDNKLIDIKDRSITRIVLVSQIADTKYTKAIQLASYGLRNPDDLRTAPHLTPGVVLGLINNAILSKECPLGRFHTGYIKGVDEPYLAQLESNITELVSIPVYRISEARSEPTPELVYDRKTDQGWICFVEHNQNLMDATRICNIYLKKKLGER